MIFFDHADFDSAGKAKEELQSQIEASLDSPPDNPISDGMRLAQLQAGDAEEQTLAVVLDRLQRLARVTEQIDERLIRAERRGSDGVILREPVRFQPVGRGLWDEEIAEIRMEAEAESGIT